MSTTTIVFYSIPYAVVNSFANSYIRQFDISMKEDKPSYVTLTYGDAYANINQNGIKIINSLLYIDSCIESEIAHNREAELTFDCLKLAFGVTAYNSMIKFKSDYIEKRMRVILYFFNLILAEEDTIGIYNSVKKMFENKVYSKILNIDEYTKVMDEIIETQKIYNLLDEIFPTPNK